MCGWLVLHRLLTSNPGIIIAKVENDGKVKQFNPINLSLSCKHCKIEDQLPIGSRHCRTCNHCVKGFDHHCWYLGKDISRDNYVHFFSFMLIEWILIVWYLTYV